MEYLIKQIKSLSLGVKISEILYAIVILIYIYMQAGKGLFTTYYSFMCVISTGAVTSIYLMFFKKNYVYAIINLLIAAIIFINFASAMS
nr:hypothetical protein [Sedimentibacter sp.]